MVMVCLDICFDEEIKVKVEKVLVLFGLKSFIEYVVRFMDEDVIYVIEEYESIMVKDSVFDEFMVVCNKVKVLN